MLTGNSISLELTHYLRHVVINAVLAFCDSLSSMEVLLDFYSVFVLNMKSCISLVV